MKIETNYPFQDYHGYIIINRENRRHVCLYHKVDKIRKTTSYARYLMSVKLGRLLTKEEQVDHIDGDKTNDNVENLQILTIKENNVKRTKETSSSMKMIELCCPNCNNNFIKPYNQSHFQKSNGKFNTCSKKCLHEFLKKGLSIQELIEVGKNQTVRLFRK